MRHPPGVLQALRDADAALRAGDRNRALAIAEEACRNGAEHFVLLTLAAQHELARGNPAGAIALAQRARLLEPRNSEVLNTLGAACAVAGRHRDALDAFESALRAAPAAWPIRLNKAAALEALQEFGQARVEFERVLEYQPRHAEAITRLAALALQRGDIAEARRRAAEALRLDPSRYLAELTLAEADNAAGQYEAAFARIERLGLHNHSDLKLCSIAQNVMADALDGLGRTDDAFAHYIRAKQTMLALDGSRSASAGRESAAALVARLTNYFVAGGLRAGDGDARPSAPEHAFIVGFPRSGTTLLEQVLAGHPDVEVMGERSCLVAAQESFTIPADGLDRLASLGDGDLAPWQDAYWRRVAEEGFRKDRKLFVDKMPFYCVLLCLIARLFPRAKILSLIRDPRDVVLSCLRQRFVMTEHFAELASVEAAAAHYDAVMSLCDVYRRTLALEICDVRYEDLVGRFDAETRRVCAFLGLEWQQGLDDIAPLAAKRSIATPSGPQLARGLEGGKHGQWRRYAAQLAPAMPRLAPWIERFGYARD